MSAGLVSFRQRNGFFYRFDRVQLRSLSTSELRDGCHEFVAALGAGEDVPAQYRALVEEYYRRLSDRRR